MQKCLHKILFFVAVVTVISHSVLPHTHHHDHEITHHNYDEHNDHENIFSFAELDEAFVPAKFQFTAFELPIVYLLAAEISDLVKLTTTSSKAFSFYREYPPPNNYYTDLPSRAPPFSKYCNARSVTCKVIVVA